MRSVYAEKIEEIVSFAENNDKLIRYNRVIDILKDKNTTITEKEIEEVLDYLSENGIYVIREDDEDYLADEIEPELFIPADVNISQRPVNVYNLMERLENEEINLMPNFQRHGNLWSLEAQSRLIESLMLKIPIPAFYFDAINEAEWVVIDGLQRLTAFQNFLVGIPDENGVRIKEKFVGLQYLTEFENHTIDELPRQYIRRIKEASLVAYTVEKGTPDAVVYNIFQRINTGGVGLNAQEIRQALYVGEATEMIQQLAECEEFLSATQNAIPKDRMIDREYVTRFIAFTELDYHKEYRGNIDSFLNKTLKLVNGFDENKRGMIVDNFKRIMRYCGLIFEKYAFRRISESWRRGPINKALFELWGICLSELSDEQLDSLVERKQQFLDKYKGLMQRSEFITALKAGDQYSTIKRIDMVRNLVKEFV